MQRLGVYLIFFAIGSAILSQTNYQFRILFWMEEMGNGAWVVRAIMVAIGAFMLLGGRMTRAQSQPGRISVPAPRPNPHAVHQAAQHDLHRARFPRRMGYRCLPALYQA